MPQSNEQLNDGFRLLEEAIIHIDMMIRQYRFVTKISGVRDARIKLEQSSRIFNKLIVNMKDNTPTNCHFCKALLPGAKTQDDIVTAEIPEEKYPALDDVEETVEEGPALDVEETVEEGPAKLELNENEEGGE